MTEEELKLCNECNFCNDCKKKIKKMYLNAKKKLDKTIWNIEWVEEQQELSNKKVNEAIKQTNKLWQKKVEALKKELWQKYQNSNDETVKLHQQIVAKDKEIKKLERRIKVAKRWLKKADIKILI